MIKKTIAVDALALLATSGLATARTVHAKPSAESAPATIAPLKFPGGNDMNDGSTPKVVVSFEAPYGHAGGLDNVRSFNHPGDNDMDPILNH